MLLQRKQYTHSLPQPDAWPGLLLLPIPRMPHNCSTITGDYARNESYEQQERSYEPARGTS